MIKFSRLGLTFFKSQAHSNFDSLTLFNLGKSSNIMFICSVNTDSEVSEIYVQFMNDYNCYKCPY